MKFRKHDGAVLSFSYPDFLKVKGNEPNWYAVGPKSLTTALVVVDPNPVNAAAKEMSNAQ